MQILSLWIQLGITTAIILYASNFLAKSADNIDQVKPQVTSSMFGGPEWEPQPEVDTPEAEVEVEVGDEVAAPEPEAESEVETPTAEVEVQPETEEEKPEA